MGGVQEGVVVTGDVTRGESTPTEAARVPSPGHRQGVNQRPEGIDRASCCSVGRRPNVADIDAALREGDSLGTVSKRFHVPKASLARHKTGCLSAVSRPSHGGDGEDETVKFDSRARIEPLGIWASGTSRVAGDRSPDERPSAGSSQSSSQVRETPSWKLDEARKAHPDRPATKEARVTYLIRLMSSLRFVKGSTAEELAALWGLGVGTLTADAAEASRRLTAMIDPVEARKAIAGALAEGAQRALDEGDVRALSSAARVWAEVAGVIGPGVQVTINHPLVQPVALQIAAVYRRVVEVELPEAGAMRVLSAMQEGAAALAAEGEKGFERWLDERRRDANALPTEVEVVNV